jgi:hypothetical protein
MTHERGHTLGLGDVSEAYHPNLTMSSQTNGPCQTSERTLGRGDAIGLHSKYSQRPPVGLCDGRGPNSRDKRPPKR